MRRKGPNEHWIDQHGVMHIKLTQGKEALIDAEDWPLVSQYRWHTALRHCTWYAETRTHSTPITLSLHQAIHGRAPEGYHIDHISGNGLDNRKANLRLLTYQQSGLHKSRAGRTDNNSGHRGVYHNTLNHGRNHYWRFMCQWGHSVPGMPRYCCTRRFEHTDKGLQQAVAFARQHWDTVHPDCTGFEEAEREELAAAS